jgi:acyl-CoA thioester hydrolase
MSHSKKELEITLRIDWSDLDYYAHVNNLSIARYMQSARVNFWELSGLAHSYQKHNKGPILVNTESSFKKALHYPGTVTIKTKVAKIGRSSFALEHLLYNSTGELCTTSIDTVVFFDFTAQKSLSIPEQIRKIMNDYS